MDSSLGNITAHYNTALGLGAAPPESPPPASPPRAQFLPSTPDRQAPGAPRALRPVDVSPLVPEASNMAALVAILDEPEQDAAQQGSDQARVMDAIAGMAALVSSAGLPSPQSPQPSAPPLAPPSVHRRKYPVVDVAEHFRRHHPNLLPRRLDLGRNPMSPPHNPYMRMPPGAPRGRRVRRYNRPVSQVPMPMW